MDKQSMISIHTVQLIEMYEARDALNPLKNTYLVAQAIYDKRIEELEDAINFYENKA